MVFWLFYICNENSYTNKTASLYRNSPLSASQKLYNLLFWVCNIFSDNSTYRLQYLKSTKCYEDKLRSISCGHFYPHKNHQYLYQDHFSKQDFWLDTMYYIWKSSWNHNLGQHLFTTTFDSKVYPIEYAHCFVLLYNVGYILIPNRFLWFIYPYPSGYCKPCAFLVGCITFEP